MIYAPAPVRYAIFDKTKRYRYILGRAERDDLLPILLWVMLNPSVADAMEDDKTVQQCWHFTRAFGYHAMEIVNQYALVSTDPAALRTAEDPIGPENDYYIQNATLRAQAAVIAWGTTHPGPRQVAMLALLGKLPLYCLGRTKSGAPRHPSRLAHATPFERFDLAATG